MVHVVMGEDEIFDRLAGILGLGRVDGPSRLQLSIGRVEDHQIVLHGDDQVVGGAALDVLHVGGKLDQLEAAAANRANSRRRSMTDTARHGMEGLPKSQIHAMMECQGCLRTPSGMSPENTCPAGRAQGRTVPT
jgi:hypothetical protein